MMSADLVERFPELQRIPGIAHGFILRQPGVEVSLDRQATLQGLRAGFDLGVEEVGLSPKLLATAEQVHGGKVAHIRAAEHRPGVDGLITDTPGLALGIVVADCCAVYLIDPVKRALGLVHSGRKGTELEITAVAIRQMGEAFGSRAEDLLVRLSPCIRPPEYEVDIASAIRDQAIRAGVPAGAVIDDGICTASNLDRYYSYRAEQGATGRMLAVLGLVG